MKFTKYLIPFFISLELLPTSPAFAQIGVPNPVEFPIATCTTFAGTEITIKYPRIDGSVSKNILKISSISKNKKTISTSTIDYYIGNIKLVEVTPDKGTPSFFAVPEKNKFKEFYLVNLTYKDGLGSSPLFLKVQSRNVKLYLTGSNPNSPHRPRKVLLASCKKIEFEGL